MNEESTCFVIMPFDDGLSPVLHAIREAVDRADEGLRCVRLDDKNHAGRITDDLTRTIENARVCIADLSGLNPNVMWEVGFAMSREKPVIFLAQDTDRLPFDIRDFQVIKYSLETATQSLSNKIVIALKETSRHYQWHAGSFWNRLGRLRITLVTSLLALLIASVFLIVIQRNKAKVENGLNLSAKAWETASRSWLDEPSGLSGSGLTDSMPGRILVAVDDNESAVFVLNSGHGRFPLVRAMLELVVRDAHSGQTKAVADDLEAIAYDGSEHYYALGSHRLLGDDKKASATRKLARFQIHTDDWKKGAGNIVVDQVTDLTAPPHGPGLEEFLRNNSVDILSEKWGTRKVGEPQEYALELEGMAYWSGRLFLGLRFPLDAKNNALLLSYSLGESSFNGIWRLDLKVGDVAHGISALSVTKAGDLIVASNPPPKTPHAYGESCLWSFGIDGLISSGSIDQTFHGDPRTLQPKPGVKLEGIAAEDSQLFLAFEGEAPEFDVIAPAGT